MRDTDAPAPIYSVFPFPNTGESGGMRGGGVKYAKSDRCPSPKNPSPTPCQLPPKNPRPAQHLFFSEGFLRFYTVRVFTCYYIYSTAVLYCIS